ncbi:hypothetical protein DSECCO2_317860 [anaerobic digester metagenome]
MLSSGSTSVPLGSTGGSMARGPLWNWAGRDRGTSSSLPGSSLTVRALSAGSSAGGSGSGTCSRETSSSLTCRETTSGSSAGSLSPTISKAMLSEGACSVASGSFISGPEPSGRTWGSASVTLTSDVAGPSTEVGSSSTRSNKTSSSLSRRTCSSSGSSVSARSRAVRASSSSSLALRQVPR